MGAINVETLLEPVSDDAPSGGDMEYDETYLALVRESEGVEEKRTGDKVIPAVKPKWGDVAEQASALLAQTKDLRIAILLARAQLHLEGLTGFDECMQLITRLTKDFWDTVHPQLDAEDDDDPTMRMNALAALADRELVVDSLINAPLVSSKTLGTFSMRDIRLASGEISPGKDEEAPDPTHINAAFLDCDLDELKASDEATTVLQDQVAVLNEFVADKVGADAPNLDLLVKELGKIKAVCAEQLSRRGVNVETEGEEDAAGESQGAGISGEIRSREDVARMLDKMCEYFRRNEPSSPVPILLQRAKRLVSKDFMEILRDLTPDGVAQAEMIGGTTNDD